MRKLYNELLSLLNISGRDLAVFLLALLLAFSIWLIHNLSLKYNAYLDVPVQALCNIDGHAEMSVDHSNVVARCRATGYNVIRSGIRKRSRVVQVTFQPNVMKHKEDDLFYVLSSDLQEYAHLIFGDGVSVEYFATDTLFYHFPHENSKRIPVQPVYTVTFQSQHMAEGPMEVQPDSVTVYGDPFLLENVTKALTEPIRYSHVSSDIQGEVRLEDIRGLRISEETVRYGLKVSRYVELSGKIPVMTSGVPSDKSMTVFPSVVRVVLKCRFPFSGDPIDKVVPTVDYAEYQQSLSGKCVVSLEDLPRGVISYDVEPGYVECIVEDLQ